MCLGLGKGVGLGSGSTSLNSARCATTETGSVFWVGLREAVVRMSCGGSAGGGVGARAGGGVDGAESNRGQPHSSQLGLGLGLVLHCSVGVVGAEESCRHALPLRVRVVFEKS